MPKKQYPRDHVSKIWDLAGKPPSHAVSQRESRPCLSSRVLISPRAPRCARRLREARVTGVTCASSTLPLVASRAATRTGRGLSSRAAAVARTTLGGTSVGLTRRAGSSASGPRFSRVGGRGERGGSRVDDGAAYDIVLLDECSQMVEPVSLLPLAAARPRRLVLVGDPMQLPPAVAHARVRNAFCRWETAGRPLQSSFPGVGAGVSRRVAVGAPFPCCAVRYTRWTKPVRGVCGWLCDPSPMQWFDRSCLCLGAALEIRLKRVPRLGAL